MVQHVNPGLDATINPVVIDDSYREKRVKETCGTCGHCGKEPFDNSGGIPFFLCDATPFVVTPDTRCQNTPSLWELRK